MTKEWIRQKKRRQGWFLGYTQNSFIFGTTSSVLYLKPDSFRPEEALLSKSSGFYRVCCNEQGSPSFPISI